MKTGDVLMFKGTGFLSWLIKTKTKSVYSHAGVIAWWGNRLMVLEAIGSGIVARPISYVLTKYEGGFDYFRPKKVMSDDEKKTMLDYAQRQLGKKYASIRLLKYFFIVMLNLKMKPSELNDAPGISGKYFCSHYVAAIYNAVGVDLQVGMSDKYTTPDQIANSEELSFIGTLKSFNE